MENTPFSNLDNEDCPRWTPFDERPTQDPKIESSAVRKKLGFESLFDTSDPNVAQVDDVIGLCSGQFMTQPQPLNTQSHPLNSQEDQSTPDTVLYTQSSQSQMLSQNDFLPEEEKPEGKLIMYVLTNYIKNIE